MLSKILANIGWNAAGALLWVLLIVTIVVFSSVSTTQFIYNRF